MLLVSAVGGKGNAVPLRDLKAHEREQPLGRGGFAVFFIGQRDLATEWDTFMEEVDKRGLPELTEALNEWYNMYY